MRVLIFLILLATLLLSILILSNPVDSAESWTAAILLFITNSVLWFIITAAFFEHWKRAKESDNQALSKILGVLCIVAIGMALDSLYAAIITASAKEIVIPAIWFSKYFDRPFAWSLPALIYNLIAIIMLYWIQKGVLEQMLQEREIKKELEEKNQMLKSIEIISRTLNDSLNAESMLKNLTQRIVAQFKVDLCTIRLVNRQNELVVEAAYGHKSPELIKSVMKINEGLSGWVFTQQRVLQVNNLSNDYRVNSDDPLVRVGVVSYIGLPLILPLRGTLGCLELYRFDRYQISAHELDTLALIANESAISIQNARNYEEVERRRKELESLNKFSSIVDSSISEDEIYRLFLNEISQRFDVTQVIILQKSNKSDMLEIVSSLKSLTPKQEQLPILEDPAQCRALRTGKDILIPDVGKGVICICDLLLPQQGSYLCQPLIMGGKALGLVHLSSKDINYWDEDKHRIVSAFVSTMAPAIRNLQLVRLEKERAITDQLTQVHNRRFLDEYISKQNLIFKRQHNDKRTPMAILMLDLDHFKFFNDEYGHEIGDMVLQYFASTLVATVRSSDLIARYGGEEFCVLLTDTNLKGALDTAEKIRKAVENIEPSFLPKNIERNITVSIGIAGYPEHGLELPDILKKADHALLEAKKNGRNRVIIYQLGKDELLFADTKSGKNSV